MATVTAINAKVQLRRAALSTYESHPDFVPLNGEVCFVDCPNNELKIKVGNGITAFASLDYSFAKVITGYYYNGDFYYNRAHTDKSGRYLNTVYIELDQKIIYFYDGEQQKYVDISTVVSDATPTQKGIMKLYPNTGQNTDGTMTQKSITDGMENLKLEVDGEILTALY